MLIFIILFYKTIFKLNTDYRNFNEKMKMLEQNQQIQLMRVTNYIEQGRDYLQIYKQQAVFYQEFVTELEKGIKISNKTMCLGLWVKLNFQIIIIFFLVISISLYWILQKGYLIFIHEDINILSGNSSFVSSEKNYAPLAVLIKQVITLTDYISYFSMSLANTRAKAVSIERIRRYAENKQIIDHSNQRQTYCEKRRDMIKKSFIEGPKGKIREKRS